MAASWTDGGGYLDGGDELEQGLVDRSREVSEWSGLRRIFQEYTTQLNSGGVVRVYLC